MRSLLAFADLIHDTVAAPRRPSRRERIAVRTLLLLAPLALALALGLRGSHGADPESRFVLDRPAVVARALDEARRNGLDLQHEAAQVRLKGDGPLYEYLRDTNAPDAVWVRKAAPPVTLEAKVGNPDRGCTVILSPDGRLLGHSVAAPEQPATQPPAPERVTALARQAALSGLPPVAAERLGQPEVTTLSPGRVPTLRHAWRVPAPSLPDVTVSRIVETRGAQVVAVRTTAEMKHRRGRRTTFDWITAGVIALVTTVYFVVLSLFVLVRYLQRTLQKEVSQFRTLLVAGTIGLFFTGFLLLTDVGIQGKAGTTLELLSLFAIVGVVMLLMGGVAGVAYSGSEGDLREKYPGKLTSLDALLLGRPLCRNVGASVLLGAAAAAWLLLAVNMLLRAGLDRGVHYLETMGSALLYSRQPVLAVLFNLPTNAILLTLFGVLLPVTLLHRLFRRRPRWVYVLLPLLAGLGLALIDREGSHWWLFALVTVKVGAVLGAFFVGDLLAATVTLLAFNLLHGTVGMSRLAPFYAPIETLVAVSTVAIVALAVVALRHGRTLRDDEVRPLYARLQAERLSLKDEVSAAHEAQLRLLPVSMPQIDGLDVAASFRAAELAGGDFYDFFPLGAHRLGILMLDGGGRGLATALTIAFAKGFLAERAPHDEQPGDTVRALFDALAAQSVALDAGLCYAVVDAGAGTLRYVRAGETPRLLVAGTPGRDEAGQLRLDRLETLQEHQGRILHTGATFLQPGTRLLVYTDGLPLHAGRVGAERWLREQVAYHHGAPAAALQQGLWDSLILRRRSARALRDDIALVVVGVQSVGASHREAVA